MELFLPDDFVALELFDESLGILLSELFEVLRVNGIRLATPHELFVLNAIEIDFNTNHKIFPSIGSGGCELGISHGRVGVEVVVAGRRGPDTTGDNLLGFCASGFGADDSAPPKTHCKEIR